MIRMSREIIILKNEIARMKIILEEDLNFARGTEEAWQEIDEGECGEYSTEEFFENLKNDN